MRSIACHLLAVSLAAGSTACALHRAQPISALSPGAPVRVTEACLPPRGHEVCPRYRGELVSLDRDSLRLRPSSDSVVRALGVADVARLEVRTGRQNVILLGIGVGMVVGSGIGGLATQSQCADYRGSLPCFPSGFGYGALVGAIAGGVVGALIHPERWARVAWPPPE